MLNKEIIGAALHALKATTGLVAQVRPGALLRIKAAGKTFTFLPEVKTVDRFATPALVKTRKAAGRLPILVAPYITRQTAEHCRALKLPFIDTAGNAYIEAEGLLVYVIGQPRPAELVRDKFRALTPAGLQLTFALLCRPDLLQQNYRTIAKAAKIALGTVGPAIKDLEKRGLIADYPRLLDEWVTRYPTTLRPKLEARRLEADPALLAKADLTRHHAFWGGEAAADRLAHMLRPTMFTIYAGGDWKKLAGACRMRANPDGNVEILNTFWDFHLDGLDPDVAPPVLVYADLMATRDGRNVEVANLIHERYLEPKLRRAG